VTPTGFGFERYDLIPHPGGLTRASGAVPTSHGTIRAAWRAHPGGRFELTVTAPAGTTGRIGVPTAGRRVHVEVDGEPAWDGAAARGWNARTDGRYVYLQDVPPGTYHIVARPIAG
jgi:Bacterial alpha-L-rhamnosidase C-terminal domain